jgi:hypothetical protein
MAWSSSAQALEVRTFGLRQIGAWSFGPKIVLLCCVSASGEFDQRHHMALNVVCDFRIGL